VSYYGFHTLVVTQPTNEFVYLCYYRFEDIYGQESGVACNGTRFVLNSIKITLAILGLKYDGHTYIHTYIQTNIHTYIQTYIYTNTHTYIHTYIHTYVLHTYLHTCMHAYTHRQMTTKFTMCIERTRNSHKRVICHALRVFAFFSAQREFPWATNPHQSCPAAIVT